MGRYRQWLYHQELDRQLYTRLQHLETELVQLQEQANRYIASANTLSRENQLIVALALSMDANMPLMVFPDKDTEPISPATHNSALSLEPPTENISPAPYAWEQLSTLRNAQVEANTTPSLSQTVISNTPYEGVLPSLPQDELSLSPGDMAPSFDGESPTEPQRELPRWLHSLITLSLNNNQTTRSVNPESIRSNRLFQRWSERWGQPCAPTIHANEQQLPRKENES